MEGKWKSRSSFRKGGKGGGVVRSFMFSQVSVASPFSPLPLLPAYYALISASSLLPPSSSPA